jgi:hypothetical protein
MFTEKRVQIFDKGALQPGYIVALAAIDYDYIQDDEDEVLSIYPTYRFNTLVKECSETQLVLTCADGTMLVLGLRNIFRGDGTDEPNKGNMYQVVAVSPGIEEVKK